jgi:endonuclease/exonuclease/phosphatase (EEP) superfamily protein YafD
MGPTRLLLNGLAAAVLLAPLGVAVAGLMRLDHRWPDLLVQFTAPALIATTGFTLLLLLGRLFPAAGLGLAACLLLALAGRPQWFPHQGHARPGAPAFTLYSANLWARNGDLPAIRRSIAAADADVVLLIEVGDAPGAQLDDLLQGYPHRLTTRREPRDGGAVRSVIAARHPLTALDAPEPGLSAQGATVALPGGPVHVVSVHLTRPWPFQYQYGQVIQVEKLARFIAPLDGPVIVAGDFNSVSNGRIGRQMQRDAGLRAAPGWPGTWPSVAPAFIGMTIDQVWYGPELALTDRRLAPRTGSDHRAVVTRFSAAAY